MSSSIPTLSMAQILADLNGLQNTEPPAAHALLTAQKTLSSAQIRRKSRASILPEPPKFDKLGRRIVQPLPTTLSVPKPSHGQDYVTLGGSRGSESSGSSGNGGLSTPVLTPVMEGLKEKDPDMYRAKELVELYDRREKFTETGLKTLDKATLKVRQAMEKYNLDERQKAARLRQSSVGR